MERFGNFDSQDQPQSGSQGPIAKTPPPSFDWDGFYRSFDSVLRAGARSAWARRPAKLQGEDLCDCLQAVYCRLLECHEHLPHDLRQRHDGVQRFYLYRLARRTVVDYLRRLSRDKRGGGVHRLCLQELEACGATGVLATGRGFDPETRLLQRERVRRILQRLCASASTRAQARLDLLLVRARLAGHTGAELVAELSKTAGEPLNAEQIYSRAARLRARLRRNGIEHKGNVL